MHELKTRQVWPQGLRVEESGCDRLQAFPVIVYPDVQAQTSTMMYFDLLLFTMRSTILYLLTYHEVGRLGGAPILLEAAAMSMLRSIGLI